MSESGNMQRSQHLECSRLQQFCRLQQRFRQQAGGKGEGKGGGSSNVGGYQCWLTAVNNGLVRGEGGSEWRGGCVCVIL